LIPGGRYSVDFAVHGALLKEGFHLPLTRQERLYAREGLVVQAQPLWHQLDALARRLQKSYEALLAEVFTSPLLHHANETHWYLLDKGPDTKGYAWTVASPDTGFQRICLIDTARLRGVEPGHSLRRAALAAIESPGTVMLPKAQR
jgi:transposase